MADSHSHKKPYAAPALTCYGKVGEITQNLDGPGGDGGSYYTSASEESSPPEQPTS